MSKTEYKYGNRKYSIDAQIVGEEFERIKKEYGNSTPEIIVNESRPENSALHSLFDWNDDTAAENWRKQQARLIAGSLVTVKVNGKALSVPVRAIVSINDSYEPLSVVIKTPTMKDIMLKDAYRDLMSITRKYAALEELSGLFDYISNILPVDIIETEQVQLSM